MTLAYLKRTVTAGGHYAAGEAGVFQSGDLTGTGSKQTIPHGLGSTPSMVRVYLVGGPVAYAAPLIVQDVHDSTNVYVTVTVGWVYRVEAHE